MFSTSKLMPLKVFSWKSLKVLAEQGDVDIDPRPVIFQAELKGVVELRIELQVARVLPWLMHRTCAGGRCRYAAAPNGRG